MKHKLLYIIGAYSGDTLHNIQRAEQVSINLIRNGFWVITPHKNTSGYEKYEDGAITYETWLSMDIAIMMRCDGVYVMSNWTNSKGAAVEISVALSKLMPIIYERTYPSDKLTMVDWIREFGGKHEYKHKLPNILHYS